MQSNDISAQDPLAQLKDIQLPEPIGIWPPAPGWWILALIIIGLTIFIAWKYFHHKKQQQYRTIAVALLNSQKAALKKHNNVAEYLKNISSILRRTALTAYPLEGVEPLQGEKWLAFLDKKIETKLLDKKYLSFQHGDAKKIITLPYQNSKEVKITTRDISAIHNAVLFWIKFHSTTKTKEAIQQANQKNLYEDGLENKVHHA